MKYWSTGVLELWIDGIVEFWMAMPFGYVCEMLKFKKVPVIASDAGAKQSFNLLVLMFEIASAKNASQ